jgi:hypothetical protein
MRKWATRIALAFVGVAAVPLAVLAQTPAPPPIHPETGAVLPYCWDSVTLGYAVCGSGHTGGTVSSKIGPFTIVPLDTATVTTGGVAVTALAPGHASAGGFLVTSNAAGICVDQSTTAGTVTGTPSTTVCVVQGQVYNIVPSGNVVSVNSAAPGVSLAGEGWQ